MKAHGVLVALMAAWCAWPGTARAQAPAAPDGTEQGTPATGAKAHACVDPSDASARRWYQEDPCRWPMIQPPVSREPPPLPSYPQPAPGAQAGHAMFWRFPVQPVGPYEAPRHSRR